MKAKGYSIHVKTTRYAVCDYCGKTIKHYGSSLLEGYAARHVQLCYRNPANKHCETCVHARFYGLDMHCGHKNKMMNRNRVHYPCPNHKEIRKDKGA